MTDLSVLQEGRLRRRAREAERRRARRRRRAMTGVGLLAATTLALLVFMAASAGDRRPNGAASGPAAATAATPPPPRRPGYVLAPARTQIHVRIKPKNLRSGLVFEVRSGKVLWSEQPTRSLAIASLTKMMTGLLVAMHAGRGDRVMITRQAVSFSGSGVGLLPRGKRVPLMPLLYGLLLPSGNDAAIALAQHVAGSQSRFVAMMNSTARAMGLRCTHFSSVSGIVDQGNYSCSSDLAVLAHAVLERPMLRRIVSTRSAVLPFPIKGGKLYLYNNNPLLMMRYPGADGVKTGYTVAAGPCLVASARRRGRWYGVVLLHSNNPYDQARRLLDAAFAKRT